MFRFKNGFTIIGRAAFETAGRYGFTTVFNKIVVRGKSTNLFVAVPVPLRFGNEKPTSVGISLQIGLVF